MPIERGPARDGAAPVLNEKEEIKHTEPRTKLIFGQNSEGEGVLHLTNQRVVWLPEGGAGCSIDYPFITVHAVSRDPSAWPEPCLYCQLKCEEKVDIDEDEEIEIPELRFVPTEAGNLQRIFVAFSEMSALNPDPADDQDKSDSEDDDGDEDLPELGVVNGVWVADVNDAAMEDADSDEDDDGTMETEGYGG